MEERAREEIQSFSQRKGVTVKLYEHLYMPTVVARRFNNLDGLSQGGVFQKESQ